jgi:acyl dehydratase
MQSRPEAGLVDTRWELTNQRGEVVLDMRGWGMFGRRPSTAAAVTG